MCRYALLVAVVCAALCGNYVVMGQSKRSDRSVADLVADLQKGDKEKLQALQELATLGDKAAAAVPALIELLPIKNEDVRLNAALVLGKIGTPAVEPLQKAFASPDSDVRFYAVWSLSFIGPRARGATPVLVKALKDPAPDVRRKAAYALSQVDADPALVVGPLVSALGDSDADVRQTAAASLPKMSKAAVPVLIESLQSDKQELRLAAIKILGEIGAPAAAAVDKLKPFLLQPNKGAAEVAADALAGIGTPSSIAVLTGAANDDDAKVRALAVQALHKIGAPAVPTFVDLLGAKHLDVRRQAASLLGSMQVQDKMVVVGLGYATRDKDFQVRHNALLSLQNMGTAAKLAEPYVVELLTDIDPQMRQDAFRTLQNLGVDPRPGLKKALGNPDLTIRIKTASLMSTLDLEVELAVPVLLDGLKQKDETLKMQAAHALALRGLREEEVLPIFIAGLKNDAPSVRRQAAETIARYGLKAAKAIPVLIATLDDADDSVRAQALRTLRVVGAKGSDLLPAAAKILRRKNDPLHAEAAQLVFQAGPDAVGEIITLLGKDDAPALRLACLQTLAMVGPAAKNAVGELIKALDDPSPRIRMTAARALGNIGPAARDAAAALGKAEKDADANVKMIAKSALAQIRADPNVKGFEVQGVLTAGDPFDRARPTCYHVVHIYRMKAGQTYTIDMTSMWDNFLRLEDAQGRQLAQDDDSGGNLNARIIFRAPSDGSYRIIATSFAPGATGSYTLKVR
jgi:HEAT repeat protein